MRAKCGGIKPDLGTSRPEATSKMRRRVGPNQAVYHGALCPYSLCVITRAKKRGTPERLWPDVAAPGRCAATARGPRDPHTREHNLLQVASRCAPAEGSARP